MVTELRLEIAEISPLTLLLRSKGMESSPMCLPGGEIGERFNCLVWVFVAYLPDGVGGYAREEPSSLVGLLSAALPLRAPNLMSVSIFMYIEASNGVPCVHASIFYCENKYLGMNFRIRGQVGIMMHTASSSALFEGLQEKILCLHLF